MVKTVGTSSRPTTSTASSAPSPAAGSCDAKGINIKVGKEGTCIANMGVRLTVVNRDSTLKLKTLKAKLVGARTADSLSSEGETKAASGTFLVLTLSVTNRLSSPTQFDQDQDQVNLDINNKVFTENFDAENGPDMQSFLWKQEDIQPGATVTGEAVFDLPNKALREYTRNLRKYGNNIDVLDFGQTFDNATAIGIIRLWQ